MYENASKIALNATCRRLFNKSDLPYVCIAFFDVSKFLEVFRAISASFTFWQFASPKEKRLATLSGGHWPNGPNSKLRKFHKNGLILPKLSHGRHR